MLSQDKFAIVADIGGTFARFCRVDLHTLALDEIEVYPCASFESLEMALRYYQTQKRLTEIKQMAIAIACPVIDDVVSMTNCPWQFSIRELQRQLNLSALRVMNDFTAIAMSVSALGNHSLEQIGSGTVDKTKPRVILGAGTGLGVAYLLPMNDHYMAYAGEGGHADWGATSEQEWLIYESIKKRYSRVSYERLLSGQGIENIYQALKSANKKEELQKLKAQEIIQLALTKQCVVAEATIEQFFKTLAVYAGDLALIFGAFGGIYIAGGIVPRLLPLLDMHVFRRYFEDKGRFRDFNAQIPTFIITAEQPGLLGAAVSLKHALQGDMDVIS